MPSAWQGAKQSPVSGNDQQWRIQQTEVEVISQRTRHQPLKLGKFDLGVSARWLESRVRHSSRRGVLSPRESALAERIKLLKREAGSHSPSRPDADQDDSRASASRRCLLPVQSLRDRPLPRLPAARGDSHRQASQAAGVLSLAEPGDRRQAERGLGGASRIPVRRQWRRRDHPGHPAQVHRRQDPGESADVFPLSRVRQARHAGRLQHAVPGRRLPVRPGKLPASACAASSPTRWS